MWKFTAVVAIAAAASQCHAATQYRSACCLLCADKTVASRTSNLKNEGRAGSGVLPKDLEDVVHVSEVESCLDFKEKMTNYEVLIGNAPEDVLSRLRACVKLDCVDDIEAKRNSGRRLGEEGVPGPEMASPRFGESSGGSTQPTAASSSESTAGSPAETSPAETSSSTATSATTVITAPLTSSTTASIIGSVASSIAASFTSTTSKGKVPSASDETIRETMADVALPVSGAVGGLVLLAGGSYLTWSRRRGSVAETPTALPSGGHRIFQRRTNTLSSVSERTDEGAAMTIDDGGANSSEADDNENSTSVTLAMF